MDTWALDKSCWLVRLPASCWARGLGVGSAFTKALSLDPLPHKMVFLQELEDDEWMYQYQFQTAAEEWFVSPRMGESSVVNCRPFGFTDVPLPPPI